MKQTILTVLFLLGAQTIAAQLSMLSASDSQNSQQTPVSTPNIQSAINACIAMRDGVAANDTAAIRKSAAALKKCNTSDFSMLRGDVAADSIGDHMLFDEAFADSLAADLAVGIAEGRIVGGQGGRQE